MNENKKNGAGAAWRAENEARIISEGNRMAANEIIYFAEADALLADALGDSVWLLEMNDGEDD